MTNILRRCRGVRSQYDGGGDIFTQRGVGHREGYGFCDRRMFEQHFVDLARGDFLTAAIDHFPPAAGQKQVASLIEKT